MQDGVQEGANERRGCFGEVPVVISIRGVQKDFFSI